MPRTRSSPTVEAESVVTTTWSAIYEDVGGDNPASLDPNEIGEDPLPDEIRSQFDALAAATFAILGSKSMGTDRTYNVTLRGVASPGHQDEGEYVQLTINKGPNSLGVDPEAVEGESVYVVTRYSDDVGDPLDEEGEPVEKGTGL